MSQLELSPDEFWKLTPYEFTLYIKRLDQARQKNMIIIGEQSWHTGIASNIDTKKISYRRWMEQFQDPETVEKQRKENLNRGKALWEGIKGNKL